MNSETQISLQCIDIGANLTSSKFNRDLEDVLANAKDAGVSKIILTGSNEKNSQQSARLAIKNPGFLFATAGIHPHDASSFEPATAEALRKLYQQDEVVAVGECGLDFNRDFSPRDKQRTCFAAHLDLAEESGLPMFLHERDAFEEFHRIMRSSRGRIKKAVVHCFTGTETAARSYLDLDLHLGITGWICDERRGKNLREVVKLIPANRLMIETDCPYLAPRDYRPRISRNEPKYLPHILKAVAECRNEDPEELGREIWKTTCEFFKI